MKRALGAGALVLGCLASTIDARAEPTARDVAAEQLFREARDLIAQRHFKEASDKLDASEKLAPAVGTLFSLGECYAAQGRTASAWFAYRTAISLASQRSDPRRSAAVERAAAMEPLLSKIEVHAPDDVHVAIDGEPFAPDVLRAPLPIDPGPHTVDATAPGFIAWSKVVDVRGPADVTSIEVPPLEHLPDATELARARDRAATRRTVGLGVGAAGLAAVGVGSILGMQAIVKGRDANAACPSGGACGNAAAVHENDVAKTYADASSVTIPIGAAVAAVGAYVFFSTHAVPIEASARVSSSGGRLELGWSW